MSVSAPLSYTRELITLTNPPSHPQVPKTIMHFLVNSFKENLQNELVKDLYVCVCVCVFVPVSLFESVSVSISITLTPLLLPLSLSHTHRYKENIMNDLMRETEDVATRRKACREMKDLLRRGLEIVNEVRDFNTFK